MVPERTTAGLETLPPSCETVWYGGQPALARSTPFCTPLNSPNCEGVVGALPPNLRELGVCTSQLSLGLAEDLVGPSLHLREPANLWSRSLGSGSLLQPAQQ